MIKVVVNGELLDSAEAMISLLDRDVQLGMNVFETMLAETGEIDGFELHLARLRQGMERLGLSHVAVDSLRSDTLELLAANRLLEAKARVRVMALGERLMIQAEKAVIPEPTCTAVISDYLLNPASATAGIKCGSYAPNMLALREAEADDVIFLNPSGEVCETAIANIFIVSDGTVLTPHLASGCLPGVTRELLIRRARNAGIEVQQCRLLLEDLLDADEVFFTNSLIGLRSAERIGEVVYEAFPMAEKLRKIYQDGDQ